MSRFYVGRRLEKLFILQAFYEKISLLSFGYFTYHWVLENAYLFEKHSE